MNTPDHCLPSIILKMLICFSLLGLMVGCSTANPNPEELRKIESTAAIIKCAQENKREIVMSAIDGKPTVSWFQVGDGVKEAEVEEGTHDIDLICTVGDTVYKGRLEIAVIPKHIYQVHVKILGYGARFAAEDITPDLGMSPIKGQEENE